MPEDAKRALLVARAGVRRKKLRELAIAIVLGLLCSGLIVGLILLLNNR
jgi:hypothetical protein